MHSGISLQVLQVCADANAASREIETGHIALSLGSTCPSETTLKLPVGLMLGDPLPSLQTTLPDKEATTQVLGTPSQYQAQGLSHRGRRNPGTLFLLPL